MTTTWVPGEALLMKLWETLAEKGVGGLLKPWQIKREALASAEARRNELLLLADAQRQADDIRAGRLKLADSKYALRLEGAGASPGHEPQLPPAVDVVVSSVVSDALRKEVNVAKAITFAEENLRDDNSRAPDEGVDADWLYRWRDNAGSVSSEELQSLWGRVLAGEVKCPGAFSYRTLDFIKNLTKAEAEMIEKAARFVLSDAIFKDTKTLDSEGLEFHALLDLQDLGVIGGVDGLGLKITVPSLAPDKYVNVLRRAGRGVVVEHSDASKKFEVAAYSVTVLGRQVLSLTNVSPHEQYLEAVAKRLLEVGAEKVGVADIEISADRLSWKNYRQISPEPPKQGSPVEQ